MSVTFHDTQRPVTLDIGVRFWSDFDPSASKDQKEFVGPHFSFVGFKFVYIYKYVYVYLCLVSCL